MINNVSNLVKINQLIIVVNIYAFDIYLNKRENYLCVAY